MKNFRLILPIMAADNYYNEDTAEGKEDSIFKRVFKQYKNGPVDKFSSYGLIDFDRIDSDNIDPEFAGDIFRISTFGNCSNVEKSIFDSAYLHFPVADDTWRIFGLKDKPGFKFIRNPFQTPVGHFYWASRCLRQYAHFPHVTNVDSLLASISPSKHIFESEKLLKKLRWSTMGYHHDWDTKIYDETRKSTIPEELKILSSTVATVLGYGHFQAEAVIVNFYRHNSTLAGHVDKSERDFSRPLISFSFGRPAIFLIGGPTLDEKPCAVKIRSGDAVIMDGECRLAYHAVPKIMNFDAEEEQKLFSNAEGYQEYDEEIRYLKENRINLNVRQVN